jgi:hypothetical protein
VDDTVRLANVLKGHGVDLLSVSSGGLVSHTLARAVLVPVYEA